MAQEAHGDRIEPLEQLRAFLEVSLAKKRHKLQVTTAWYNAHLIEVMLPSGSGLFYYEVEVVQVRLLLRFPIVSIR